MLRQFYARRDGLVSKRVERRSPFDRAFFGSIDLRQLVGAVEESLHVVEQEALRFRIGKIEAVMIDDPSLCLQPFSPARLANFIRHFLSEIGW